MRFLKSLTLVSLILAYACGSKYETGVDPSPPTTTSCLDMDETNVFTANIGAGINLEVEFEKLSGYNSNITEYVRAVARLDYYGSSYCCGNINTGVILLNDGSWVFNDSSDYGLIVNMVLQCIAITPYSQGSMQLILGPQYSLQNYIYLRSDKSFEGFIKINNSIYPVL